MSSKITPEVADYIEKLDLQNKELFQLLSKTTQLNDKMQRDNQGILQLNEGILRELEIREKALTILATENDLTRDYIKFLLFKAKEELQNGKEL